VGHVISLVIPVYKNEENLPDLLNALGELAQRVESPLEVVFVVDGSPDNSLLALRQSLPAVPFDSQLLSLSRNFGSLSAIHAGLAAARGDYMVVLAADLQEPPDLVLRFHEKLRDGEFDIAVGQRRSRGDPAMSRLSSALFWGFYRRFIQPDIPKGGVDVFACTQAVRDQLVSLTENNTSLLGLLFWVGFRRTLVPYDRLPRKHGKSAWTLTKKLRYLSDSVFSFSNLPILLLLYVGSLGLAISLVFATVVVVVKFMGEIPVPGYAGTVLVVTFFGALNCFGLGLLGSYVWRTFENTKQRPGFIVARHETFEGGVDLGGEG
jgi:glycosyltransferase involved in cell wall biosynthesis